jgi:urease accessory protein
MIQATDICEAIGKFDGHIVGSVTLDFDHRRRRRLTLCTDEGTSFLLNLVKVHTLRDGDILLLQDGAGVQVRAKSEPVLDIHCADLKHLVRISWHLGNRHLPTELMGDRLRIRQDHVIEQMVQQLGAQTRRLNAPFNPEGGAYGHGETEGHSHG